MIKELTTSDPSSNQINYVKFTVVFAASLATKEYLGNPKILPEFRKKFSFCIFYFAGLCFGVEAFVLLLRICVEYEIVSRLNLPKIRLEDRLKKKLDKIL